jgi:hypothetical protein
MPRFRKNAHKAEADFESDDDAFAEPDDFLEGLRSAVARARSSMGDTFDLGGGRWVVDLDGLGQAEYGD